MDRLRRWKKRISKGSFDNDKKTSYDEGASQATRTPVPIMMAGPPQHPSQAPEDISASSFQSVEEALTSHGLTYARFVTERAQVEKYNAVAGCEQTRAPALDAVSSSEECSGGSVVEALRKEKTFNYRPLVHARNEIRLLTIVPPKEWVRNTASSLEFCSEPIQCLLEHVSLEDVRSESEGPIPQGAPQRSSVPAPRALPPGYGEDTSDSQMDRRMELVMRTLNSGWISQERKNILALQLHSMNGKVAQYFAPGTQVKLCPMDEYLNSFIWTPADREAMAAPGSYYFALSYPWGDLTDLRTITVNGIAVVVSRNLEAALRALREMPEVEYGTKLWVDALCINQLDLREKSREIRRMSEIFGGARKVISWVGHEEEGNDEAIDFILAGYRQVRDLPARNAEGEDSIEPLLRWWLSNPQAMTMEPGHSIINLFNRPYWRRMWIVQEVLLGRLERGITICGKRRLSTLMVILWGRIVYGMIQREGMIERTNNLFGALMPSCIISAVEELDLFKMHTWDLDTIRFSTSMSRDVGRLSVSDQRDLVYGQLSLLHPAISELVTVDYESEVRQVYANFAFAVIKGTQSLEWILEVKYRWNWPSWVPKMGEQIHWPPPKRTYSAGGTGLSEVIRQVGPGGLQLQCMGICIGKIVRVGSLVDNKDSSISQHRYGNLNGLRSAVRACYNAKNEDPAGPTLFDLSFQVQLADVVADLYWQNPAQVRALSDKVSTIRSKYWWDFWGHRLEALIAVPGDHKDSLIQLIHAVLNCQIDAGFRELFITNTGYLGSVELTLAEDEDLSVLPDMSVWVLEGSGWPAILWGRGENYKLIGRCYVHGMMNGEALCNGSTLDVLKVH